MIRKEAMRALRSLQVHSFPPCCDKTDTNLTQFTVEFHRIVIHISPRLRYGLGMTQSAKHMNHDTDLQAAMFNPTDYITLNQDGYALCTNPMADGGLEAIMVNTRLVGEGLRNFEGSIKRMVLNKLFSPKFGEVILTATRLSSNEAA